MATPEQIAAGVPASANIVAAVPAPGGGMLYLGSDGGVFATGGAQYAGGVNNLQGDTLAGKHQFGSNALVAGPNGGYSVYDTGGHEYDFGGAPYKGGQAPPNPLAQDNSFLAFMRTSGLSADQAVRDYENQVGLAARARDAALGELNDPFGARTQDRQRLLQGNVDRGVAGAAVQKDLTGYDTETQNQAATDQSGYTDAVNKAGQDFSGTIGGLSKGLTEQGISTGQDQAWNKFLTTEAQKYPDMADKIMGSGNNPSGSTNGGA